VSTFVSTRITLGLHQSASWWFAMTLDIYHCSSTHHRVGRVLRKFSRRRTGKLASVLLVVRSLDSRQNINEHIYIQKHGIQLSRNPRTFTFMQL
jgi:hypothetical protein